MRTDKVLHTKERFLQLLDSHADAEAWAEQERMCNESCGCLRSEDNLQWREHQAEIAKITIMEFVRDWISDTTMRMIKP